VEAVKGRGYQSDASGQTTFVGCFAEADAPSRLVGGGVVWVGGNGGGFSEDTSAFIAESYNPEPFEVRNPRNRDMRLEVGYTADPTVLYGWQDRDGGDFWVVRWDRAKQIWTTENGAGAPGGEIANYLTGSGHARGAWLQGFARCCSALKTAR
jgi:hypothetical protein